MFDQAINRLAGIESGAASVHFGAIPADSALAASRPGEAVTLLLTRVDWLKIETRSNQSNQAIDWQCVKS